MAQQPTVATQNLGDQLSSMIPDLQKQQQELPGQISSAFEQRRKVGEQGLTEQRALQGMIGAGTEAAYGKYAQDVQKAQDEAGKSMMEATFTPTRENANDLMQLFSMLSVAAMMAGGKGRQSGLAAMNAMSGALEGYQKGRKDVFANELKQFEARMKEVQMHNQNVRTKLEDALRTYQVNRDAGIAKIKGLEMELQGSQAAAKLRMGDIDSTIKYLSEQDKSVRQTLLKFAEMQKKEEQARKDREARLEAARIRGSGTGRATQQQFIIQRAISSLGGLSSAIKTIKELPSGTTTGLLPNLQTKDGMFNYVRNTIGRKISSADADQLNTIFTGIGRNLAAIEASGMATGLTTLADQMQKGVYINSGVDDPYKVAMKIADIRRIATENIRPAINSGLMTDKQAAEASKLVEEIEKDIPYTTVDVARAGQKHGQMTIGESAERAVRNPRAPRVEQSTPVIPLGVPTDAQYSPSQKSWWWKDANGNWKSQKVE